MTEAAVVTRTFAMAPVPDSAGLSPEIILGIAIGVPSLFVTTLSLYVAYLTFSLSRAYLRPASDPIFPPFWWRMHHDMIHDGRWLADRLPRLPRSVRDR